MLSFRDNWEDSDFGLPNLWMSQSTPPLLYPGENIDHLGSDRNSFPSPIAPEVLP